MATDFGISVDTGASPSAPGHPTRQASDSPTALAGTSLPDETRPSSAEERLPVDVRERLSLRKQQIVVSLRKHGASQDAEARVVLVLDASGSMSGLYARGVVARVVERMAAVAAQLDDDGRMQAWTFASNSARLPDLVADLPVWSSLHVRCGEISLFNRNRQIEEQMRAAAPEPIFWQFVGLGRAGFGVLEHLDTLTGRLVDNVGFSSVDDVEKISDADLYDQLLAEFPSWLAAAAAAGVLPA